MIYELCLVTKSEAGDEGVQTLTALVNDVVSQFKGEVLLTDDWGNRTLAQATSKGVETARFTYFIFKSEENANNELLRRFGINELVLRNIIIALEGSEEEILKKYKSPFSKTHSGSVTEEIEDENVEKDRKKFSRRKSCWFTAKNIKADWKDPKTFSWLINEFGKISPARVSGISRKHQRFANTAIKRARQVGVASYMSNRVME